MNTPNNKRRRESQTRIEMAFIRLLQTHELKEITVTEVCKLAEINRTTFYANYLDIYDLAEAVQRRLEEEVAGLYQEEREQGYNSNNFLKLFRHIKENQIFYKTYFKLGIDGRFQVTEYDIEQAARCYNKKHIDYHIEFFRNGLNAMIQKWLKNGCKESPEEIYSILKEEYTKDISGEITL